MKSIFLFFLFCISVQLSFGQQYPDRHSTSYLDAWLSCTASSNPNADRGESHWISYDLGATYVLGDITLWNYNDPSNLTNGVQEIAIDVSSDGSTWTEVGTASINISEGSAFYQGQEILDLGGVSADYLLITVLSNHGGACSGFSEIKITTSSVLPVELAKQEAKCIQNGDAIMVAWHTESEIGNSHFTLQKSEDASDWKSVAELSAKGANGQGAEYSFTDKEVVDLQYYRIVNTDLDGRKEYFDIMTADCEGHNILSMSIANPFTESLEIAYNPSIDNGEVIFTIESLDGVVIHTASTNANANKIIINSSEWVTGIYIITIQQNGIYLSEKIVKI